MWPFKRSKKSPSLPKAHAGKTQHEFSQWVPTPVLPDGWTPRYYPTTPGIEAFTPYLPPALSWPDMDASACGHRAAESLMGLFSRSDPTCDVHLWCGPGQRLMVAECYQAHHPDNSLLYIGVYLWPVTDLVEDDQVVYGPMATGQYEPGWQVSTPPKPLSKALIWPLVGGDVLVWRGMVQDGSDGGSHWGQGIIDPDTADKIKCASREVSIFLPAPPQYQDCPPAFLAVRKGSEWMLSRCWQLGSHASGEAAWQASPAMFRLDAMYQTHCNDMGQDVLRI